MDGDRTESGSGNGNGDGDESGRDGPVPPDDWETVVRHVPLVSVDLVVQHRGGVVLGERTNEPARGEWFVPGGTVRKGERLRDAVDRVAREELGLSVTVDRRLGVYEHLYDASEFATVDAKHYVPVGFLVTADPDADLDPDDQHAAVRRFTPPFDGVDLHPYVAAYLTDAGLGSATD